MAIVVMVSAVVLILVSVTVLAGLVTPVATSAKLRLAGANLAVVPTPVSGTSCGLPLALSVTLRLALRAPVAVGLNVTVKVQLAFTARDVVQV